MAKVTAGSLANARSAAESLSDGCSNPRAIEANMDILCTALLKLGVMEVGPQRRPKIDLCDVLQAFVKKSLLSPSAVRCCRGIEELIQVSDYDISDFDAFESEAEAEIAVLQEELEHAFATLEKQIDDDDRN